MYIRKIIEREREKNTAMQKKTIINNHRHAMENKIGSDDVGERRVRFEMLVNLKTVRCLITQNQSFHNFHIFVKFYFWIFMFS